MIHHAKSLAVKLLLLLMLLVVLSAIFIGSMHLLTPAAGYFRGEVEQWLSQQMQRPVRIGALAARWRGLGPELVLNSVEVDSPDATHTSLRLAQMRFSLALLDSLRKFEIKTRQITLSGIKLLVRRHANGKFTIGGLDDFSGGGGNSAGLFAIPSEIRLEQSDIAFENQLIGADPQLFRNVNAVLRNAGERHQLEASLPFPGGGHLELKADIRGDFSRAGGWNADLYLNGRGIALANLLQARLARGYRIPSGRLDLELWGHWEEGRFHRTQGRVDLVQLLLERGASAQAPAHRLEIDRLGGRFLWTEQSDGWRLDVRDVAFERNGATWPSSGISISTRFDDEKRVRLLAGATFLRAEDLSAVARIFLPQHPEIAQILEKTTPGGELQDLRFEFQEEDIKNRWWLQGRIESLAMQPWKQFPGVQDLDANFWLDGDGGSLQLDSHSTVLNFPGLFRDPLQLKTLQGLLSWTQESNGSWRLESRNILAITSDIRTNTRLMLKIPAQQDASSYLDLQTDFSDGLAINAHRYYPTGIMPDALVAWLDRGIVDGKLTSGSALVRGPLHDFPFHKTQNGVFEVFFHSDNMTIDYAPGWPRLTDVAAEVRFLQNGFDVWLERGTIFDSQLKQAHGRIADFSNSPFELNGSVEGALQNNLRLLRESPLAGDFAAITKGMNATGNAVTLIDLTIPIASGQRFDLKGKIEFDGSGLQLQEWQLPLTNIQGSLNFTPRGIQGQGLSASALGSAIAIAIESLSKPQKATRITARAQVSSQQLARRFPELDSLAANGQTAWTLRLDIPHHSVDAQTAPSLLISSNLKGLDVALPSPFGKTADQARDLTLSMTIPDSGDRSAYLKYGPLVDLVLAFAADAGGNRKITRAGLQLGGKQARVPAQEGIEILGQLKSLDLTAWTSLLQSQATAAGSLPLQRLKLAVERMSAGDFDLGKVSVDFHREKGFLNGAFSSSQADGTIRIPDDRLRHPVSVQLKRLSLNYLPDPTDQPPSARSNTTDPSQLPALELVVEKTEINDKDYGELRLISQRVATGLELQTFTLNAAQLQLNATGSWSKDAQGDQQCRLQLSLTSDSLGGLLNDLGYQHYIDQAPTVFNSQLEWPDWPGGFRPAILNGEISLNLGKGQFLNVDPGIGRLFGLLNIAALQRRLSLDFSDLLGKGLAFDCVSGKFELKNGSAYTNDFHIKGPSAQVAISGRTGLVNEDFDQLVTVTPHLSAALPVAGLLAGGPIGGAAMLLAQGLIGKAFDNASSQRYQVKGPWSDPEVTSLSGNQTAADPRPKDKVAQDSAVVRSGQKTGDDAVPKPATGLLETLKRQFTPAPRTYPEKREGDMPGH